MGADSSDSDHVPSTHHVQQHWWEEVRVVLEKGAETGNDGHVGVRNHVVGVPGHVAAGATKIDTPTSQSTAATGRAHGGTVRTWQAYGQRQCRLAPTGAAGGYTPTQRGPTLRAPAESFPASPRGRGPLRRRASPPAGTTASTEAAPRHPLTETPET
jgi:hypothetical protein